MAENHLSWTRLDYGAVKARMIRMTGSPVKA